MPELVLKLGDNVVQTYVFDKDIMSIGRSRDNDIVIENLSVSRNHARIRRQGGKYILTDLNSANGTFVNGVRVSKTEIVDDDVVSLGKHKLQFVNKVVSEEEMIVEAFGADRTMVVDRTPIGVLCITDGKTKGQEFQLTKFETSIGKASSNDIVISDDWFLSKKQVVILRKGNDYEIQDLGGFRKTKINGSPLIEPRLLKSGDTIEIGSTRCLFQVGGEYSVPQQEGRVPQEMALEDSIFSSGVSYMQSEVAMNAPSPAVAGANGNGLRDESAEAIPVFDDPHELPDSAVSSTPPGVAAASEDFYGALPVSPEVSENGARVGSESDIIPVPGSDNIVLSEFDYNAPTERNVSLEGPLEDELAPLTPMEGIESEQPAESVTAGSPVATDDQDLSVTDEMPAPQAAVLEMAEAAVSKEKQTTSGSSGGRKKKHKRRGGNSADRNDSIRDSQEIAVQPDAPAEVPGDLSGGDENPSEQVSAEAGAAPEAVQTDEKKPVELDDSQSANSDQEVAAAPSDSPQDESGQPDVAREIALWEAALTNRSAVIRKQAVKMLKKLTGKDYEN